MPVRYSRTATKFIMDPKSVPKLAVNPAMGTMLGARAELGADAVKNIAPIGDSPEGEHYRDKVDADVHIEKGRFVGRVNAHKFTSGFLEFGTIQMRPRAPLRRGVESIGLRFEAKGRGKRTAGIV